MVKPKKRLGQHFLTDPRIAGKITGSLRAEGFRTVIEVGPGKGILTEFLLKNRNIDLIPVEIDNEASEYLLDHFPELQGVLIQTDFLKLNLASFGDKLGIIGNFPYNISSQIFFKVLEYRERVEEVVCMIQKEVADRIISPPGNKTYGILSVLLQTWYNVEILFTVNPGSFFPKPEVRSAVIRLSRNERKELGCDEEWYKKLIKTAFNQRRKMLRNSISGISGGKGGDSLILSKRPEQLGVEDFIDLATEIFLQPDNIK